MNLRSTIIAAWNQTQLEQGPGWEGGSVDRLFSAAVAAVLGTKALLFLGIVFSLSGVLR